MKVIIGAGPAGLYAAIKFWKTGVRDVVVYDPRADIYTRPGHLNANAFVTAESGTAAGIDADLLSGERRGHIKDLERQLYREAIRLGIRIENKRFVEFRPDATNPAVVVADADDKIEVVPADYVFDCTGSGRQVIKAVNKLSAEPPFKLIPITEFELPVKNHFLAYVKTASDDYTRLKAAEDSYDKPSSLGSSPLIYARSILALRTLGWMELKYPRYYGASFGKKGGKEKVAMYFHAPEGLTPEDDKYKKWVQTALECYTTPVEFELLPETRKFASKPRFLPFSVKAEALEPVSYKGSNLPTVIALGDAQIDFDYYLAHGIKDGMERIDALFEHMEIIDGKIYYFDADEYLRAMHDLLRAHKDAVILVSTVIKDFFSDELEPALLTFRQAMMLTTDEREKVLFSKIMLEIEARQSYQKAAKNFAECHNAAHEVSFSLPHISAVIAKLEHIHTDLLKAYTHLPASFMAEQHHTQTLLLSLALSWKEIGNALVKTGNYAAAIEAYKKAIDIYNLPLFARLHVLKELPLYSNLAIVYLKSKHYPEAIAAGQMALEIYARCDDASKPTLLYGKIVFNLLHATCLQGNALLLSRKRADARSLHSQAEHLMAMHITALEAENRSLITTKLEELQVSLSSPALVVAEGGRAGITPLQLSSALTLPEAPADGTTTNETRPEGRTASGAGREKWGIFSEAKPSRPGAPPPPDKPDNASKGCCVIS
jgi:tetratricopeptide (TPR) repeat protein